MSTLGKTATRATAELTALLRELRSLPSDVAAERCRTLAETLGQRDETAFLIQGVLSDSRLLANVASQSYPHVNKFDKIVLVGASDPQEYRLTLHFWRPPYAESGFGQEMIHSHRFNFWSTIVTGTLSSELFEECPVGQDINVLHKYRYTPEANRAAEFRDFYKFETRIGLARLSTSERYAGDSYYLDASAIHRIILPRREVTCSVVLRGPRLSEYSYVYNTSYPRYGIYLNNKMFSLCELESRLQQLMTALRTS
jgi:hypothetical protein